jgi:hypothetical protein
MTTLIDISKYTEKFTEYPTELVDFINNDPMTVTNKYKLPKLDSKSGQAIALMCQPEVRGQKHLKRKQCVDFFAQIKMLTDGGCDIQPFNKPKVPLKKIKVNGKYCLAYPFDGDWTNITKRKNAVISGDKDAQINTIKQWWRENLVDVPNEKWHTGHLDPTTPDASEANLAWQPPLQARYRNRFKWDTMFHKMWPTGQELMTKMDEYYTETEQKEIFVELMRKFLLSDDEL